ncbi:MAG: hypothetical protein AAFY88_08565, partial [Acidobacteriota bacterium]
TVFGSPGVSFGLYVINDAAVDVKESTFSTQADSSSVALFLGGTARVEATGSSFVAGPLTTAHPSVYGAHIAGGANLDSNQSNFESTSVAADNSGTGTARFGASQLVGSIAGASPSSFKCVFSYNGSFNPRAANCL